MGGGIWIDLLCDGYFDDWCVCLNYFVIMLYDMMDNCVVIDLFWWFDFILLMMFGDMFGYSVLEVMVVGCLVIVMC